MNKICNYCSNYALYFNNDEDYMCRECMIKAIYSDKDIEFKKITGIDRGKTYSILEKLEVVDSE